MIVKVVGFKKMEGVSKKSGKPFKSIVLAYTRSGAASGYIGETAGEKFIDQSLFSRDPMVGDSIMIDTNEAGFVESVDFLS